MLIVACATLALAASSARQEPDDSARREAPRFDHVILLAVDGLRPDAIDGPEDGPLPGFRRLMRGPHTLQARTDANLTITLPNHVSMVTSRPVAGEAGHGWTANDDPPAAKHGGTLHKRKGSYVASMFDVAHDRGAATAVVATKSKFSLLAASYDDENGAPDTTGSDDGRRKVDLFACAGSTDAAVRQLLAALSAPAPRSLSLLHIGVTDFVGHAEGWDMADGTAYRRAVAEADAAVVRLLQAIEADPHLRGRTAIVMTADHGGGVPFKTHTVHDAPENFLIPFVVWMGEDREPQELVALNADRRALVAATEWVGPEASPQPIRSADAGNLCLQLLGMPAIPGSTFNASQDLMVRPAAGSEPTK
ncbi:MAG: hypothetical protein RI990_1427 [Planctomycetota bacterium]